MLATALPGDTVDVVCQGALLGGNFGRKRYVVLTAHRCSDEINNWAINRQRCWCHENAPFWQRSPREPVHSSAYRRTSAIGAKLLPATPRRSTRDRNLTSPLPTWLLQLQQKILNRPRDIAPRPAGLIMTAALP